MCDGGKPVGWANGQAEGRVDRLASERALARVRGGMLTAVGGREFQTNRIQYAYLRAGYPRGGIPKFRSAFRLLGKRGSV